MNCRDTIRLLNGYVDAELDLGAALAAEEHLQACARCRALEANLRSLRSTLRRHTEFRTAPASLRARLEARYGRQGARRIAKLRSSLMFAAPGVAALLLVVWLGLANTGDLSNAPAEARAKVVFHISQSASASTALRNLANHLEVSPGTRVVVVAHNDGVDFLLRSARDESGQLYEAAIRKFTQRGVDFRVCNNTLTRRQIDSSQVIPGATLVPSGIAEISRLQTQEGYAYMRL